MADNAAFESAMRRALALAANGPTTGANPRVVAQRLNSLLPAAERDAAQKAA